MSYPLLILNALEKNLNIINYTLLKDRLINFAVHFNKTLKIQLFLIVEYAL